MSATARSLGQAETMGLLRREMKQKTKTISWYRRPLACPALGSGVALDPTGHRVPLDRNTLAESSREDTFERECVFLVTEGSWQSPSVAGFFFQLGFSHFSQAIPFAIGWNSGASSVGMVDSLSESFASGRTADDQMKKSSTRRNFSQESAATGSLWKAG